MKQYTPSEKLFFVEQVVKSGKKVSSVCRQAQVSRKTFYYWLHIYKYSKKNRLSGFASRCPKGRNHWKSLDWQKENLVLRLVFKTPKLSCRRIVKDLPQVLGKPIVSHHGVQNILAKHHLERLEERLAFAKGPFWKRMSPHQRMQMVTLAKDGQKVSQICRSFGISRKQFYKWRKRFEEREESEKHLAFEDLFKKGEEHWRSISHERTQKVLDLVASQPAWSVHQLHRQLADLVGHHGIQNILTRHGLNTFEKRLLWITTQPQPIPQVAPTMPVYSLKLKILRFLISPFTTIPKWVIAHPPSWPIAFPLFFLLAYIFQFDYLLHPQMFFPLVALTFGFFFFLYSLKYYFSLILILAFPSQEEDNQVKKGRIAQALTKIFGQQQASHLGLKANLDKVKLTRYPFISIHLPFYNERNVAERVLTACMQMDWPNYEIVVADDSTDQTTAMTCDFLRKQKGELVESRRENGDEIFTFSPKKFSLPKVTVVHRLTRLGFKGGALQNALGYTHPSSEYILVFDADFIPYPDTIEQFLKYFQLAKGNQGKSGVSRVNQGEETLDQPSSPVINPDRIAAVQGYQWHVLNKSENWITRGVRTEYAGSYVIERAGIEFYGGLKMIAGSVFCIRADLLRRFGWGASITEDFQLTLRLYEAGYKVLYTPYIQAPSECVSTIRRLARQRMRWAEGHTFNVRQMWTRLFSSPNLTGREKFEFLYLGPYYLQAAFFLVGTLAWLIAEVVIHVRLPFWSAIWGWSLVFVNFLSLPLMNIVGLFLEESEEKDYLGVASFVLLSYILVPFQAYAATKALFAREEGPWFRTPKTGRITDVIGRVRFYRWFERLKLWPKPAPAEISQALGNGQWAIGNNLLANAYSLVPDVSAFNPLAGYQIRPKRIAWVSKSMIALFLVLAMFLNYLTFFTPGVKASGTTPALEQQINIIDKEYSTINVGYQPADNSLGLIRWDKDVYDGTVNVIFEAVIKDSVGGSFCWTLADLFTAGGTEAFSEVTTNSTTYSRQRTAVTLTDDTDYTVRIRAARVFSCSSSTAYIQAARLIITQTDPTKLTKSETQVEMGSAETTSSTSYAVLADPKIYCYGSTATSTNCTNNGSTVWSPTPTAYFEATLKASGTGDVGKYSSIYCVSATDCKIVYYDAGLGALQFVDCGDATCSVANATFTLLDGSNGCALTNCSTTADVGQYLDLDCTMSASNCQISYYDATNGDLKLADCDNTVCSSGTIVTADSTGDVGQYTSIKSLTETLYGVHIVNVSYYDVTNSALKYLWTQLPFDTFNPLTLDGASGCVLSPDCSATADVGKYSAISALVTTWTKPQIAYYDATYGDLKFALCATISSVCDDGSVTTVESTNNVGQYASIYCLSAGDCKIAHYDFTNSDLRFVDCADDTCNPATSGWASNSVDTVGDVGQFSSIYCPAANNCKITYYDAASNYNLKFADCEAVDCSSVNLTTVESTNNVGQYTGVYCPASDDCKISHYDATNLDLRFIDCNDEKCTAPPTAAATLVDGGNGATSAVLYNITDSQVISNSLVKTTSTSYSRVRSPAITLTAGKAYQTQLKAAGTGNIANGKIILDQSQTAGITALETLQMYNNREISTQSSTYGRQNFDNQLTTTNFTGSITYYFESVLRVSAIGSVNTKAFAKGCTTGEGNCSDDTLTQTSSETASRLRSSSLTPATGSNNYDVFIKCTTSTDNCTTNNKIAYSDSSSWLIIQITSLPVPEKVLFFLPGIIFLPKIVEWLKRKRLAKNRVVSGIV